MKIFSVVVLIIQMIALATAAKENDAIFEYNKSISFSNLPTTMQKKIAIGLSQADLESLLKSQPSLTLDGATLYLEAPPAGNTHLLTLNRLVLKNGGRITTNGVNLDLNAFTIESDRGLIESFDKQSKSFAALGTNGRAGLDAGTIVINSALPEGEILYVKLPGQNGEDGGRGLQGLPGVAGPRGDNGADHLFDCARGGGRGGNGTKGGIGGTGGAGGPGGNGGHLVLRGTLASQRAQIVFESASGQPGAGGLGGPGGPGGGSGAGGRGTTYCRGGEPGSTGPDGESGTQGTQGVLGRAGTISAD